MSEPRDRSTAASPPARAVGAARLCVLRRVGLDGKTDAQVLAGAPVEIGRTGHVAGRFALDDDEISRRHARVAPASAPAGDGGAARWTITDLDSRNGTFVDGARVTTAPLGDGAVIRVGRALFVYGEALIRADEALEPATGSRIVGDSVAALRLHAEIGLVARHELPVLVLGETGVGKELVAEEVHRRSRRAGAFVPVNCAAIAPELAESELFGHVAGAFTGARAAADGLFVAADGGTLFLDEIGELPAELQPKLLRALAKGEVRAVGATAARTVDVRVVAATLRDLDGEVRADRFRADLLNRLASWRIEVPPLRARRDDVLAIAAALLARRRGPALGPDAAEALLLHDWPGNVRELERVLAAAAVRAGDRAELGLDHLPAAIAARLGDRAAAPLVDAAEVGLPVAPDAPPPPTRDELHAALVELGGNVARVAERYGRDRQQVYRWARRHGLDLDAYRDPRRS